MRNQRKYVLNFLLAVIIATGGFFLDFKSAYGRGIITDWYIKEFTSDIVVNKDSSLLITEKIEADCGDLPNKHGIYRVLPMTVSKSETEEIKTPIYLKSITDFEGNPYKYEQEIDIKNKVISWKIGDPNITVNGVNNYLIKYEVKNAIYFKNQEFDELYWNLNGNFWEMEIDKYSANIYFPEGVAKDEVELNFYTGKYRSKGDDLAAGWVSDNTLFVSSTKMLEAGEGITVSAIFRKNIFQPYTLTERDKGFYLSGSSMSETTKRALSALGILWSILVALVCFWLWKEYGQDPKINNTVVPEFEIPGGLSPIELGLVKRNGSMENRFLSAGIVNLAVEGYISIEQIGKKGIFSGEDYKLKVAQVDKDKMPLSEKLLFDKLFEDKSEIFMSSLENKFYTKIPVITSQINKQLEVRKLIKRSGYGIMYGLIFLAFLTSIGIFVFLKTVPVLAAGIGLGSILMIIFGVLMPSRTIEGAEMKRKISGFKMYMETAEKYRQQFLEKEGMFEKLLPYAMIFGITRQWVLSMKTIYGQEYFGQYQPYWLHGAMVTGGHFDFDNFGKTLNDLSSKMASTMASSPSSSGSGGGGFSGGGGGGGGGGGW